MNNKNVIAIFIIGVALLLLAFWAGLSVVRDRGPRADGQMPARNANVASRTRAQGPAGQEAASNIRYVVFVAAFGTVEQADRLTAELRQKRYNAAYTQTPKTNNDTLYRVNIGDYDTREAAEQVASELAAEGRKGVMIIQKGPS